MFWFVHEFLIYVQVLISSFVRLEVYFSFHTFLSQSSNTTCCPNFRLWSSMLKSIILWFILLLLQYIAIQLIFNDCTSKHQHIFFTGSILTSYEVKDYAWQIQSRLDFLFFVFCFFFSTIRISSNYSHLPLMEKPQELMKLHPIPCSQYVPSRQVVFHQDCTKRLSKHISTTPKASIPKGNTFCL